MSETKENEVEISMGKVMEYYRKGEYSRALSITESLLSQNPSNHTYHLYYAIMLQHCHMIAKAAHHIEIAFSLLPLEGTIFIKDRCRYLASRAILLKLSLHCTVHTRPHSRDVRSRLCFFGE